MCHTIAGVIILPNEFNIQWNIGNTCNLDCMYCPSVLKDGQAQFPTIQQFNAAIENIQSQTVKFDYVNIELTGGEPTLSEAVRRRLVEPIDKLKFRFHSNGTADINWWKQALPNFDEITLSLHPHVDFEHITSVMSVLHTQCKLKVLLVMPTETFEIQQFKYNVLKDRFDVTPQMLYSNFTKGNNTYINYTDAQWTWYFSETGVNPNNSFDISNTIEFKRLNKENIYKGNLCWAGHSQIIIDSYGWAFRGWCKANTALGNVYDKTLLLDRKPRVCPKLICTNGFDLSAKKSQGSWGFS